MPDTQRKKALDAVSGALAAITGVVGLTIENNRDTPVESFPTLVVADGAESVTSRLTGTVLMTINVMVEVYAEAEEAAGLRGAFDEPYGKILQALAALAGSGGPIADVRHTDTSNPDVDTRDGANPNWAAALMFEVDYWVGEADPFNP